MIDSLGLGPATLLYPYDWSARTSIATEPKLEAGLGRLPQLARFLLVCVQSSACLPLPGRSPLDWTPPAIQFQRIDSTILAIWSQV